MTAYSSTTPTSTPSSNSPENVTPKIRSNPLVREAFPLYTKEQQIIIKRNRAQLEIDIAVLKKRKKMLTDQLNHTRADFISYGELIQLKSSIELNHTIGNSQELSSLMNEYVEIVQGNYELEAECEIVAKKIKKETNRRQSEIEISNQIIDALDFSSLTINIPEIKLDIGIAKDNLLKNEISQLQKKLDDIKKEQMNNDIKVPSSNIVFEAIGSYSRKVETEWQVRSIGSNLIRSQIQNLQKQVVNSSTFMNKIENTLNKEKDKLAFVKVQSIEAIAKAKSNNDSGKLSFEEQLNQMDHAIAQLKKDIERSILNYDTINEDINNLCEKSVLFNRENDSQDDDYDDNDDYDVKDNNALLKINSLTSQKNILENEINDLKKKYQKQKTLIQTKESSLKNHLMKLSNQYANNKKIIGKFAKILSSKSDNMIDKEMYSLIDHIDSTINELRSTYT